MGFIMKDLKNINIPKSEVLRYLGHKKNQKINNLIDETIEEAKKLINPKYVLSYFNTFIKEDGVTFENTNLLLKGKDIRNHLKDSKRTVLMAVTLGSIIEKRIMLYERTNLTKALILDSCATAAVEEVCDIIEDDVKNKALKENLSITFRYSPGYGDLPLDIQRDFLNTLNANKIIGLTVSENNLLMPRKSVTAIIGLIPKEKAISKRTCEVCKNYENCSYRKEGATCGS